MSTLLILALIALVAAFAAVRLLPTDAAAWHTDPTTAVKPDKPNNWLVAANGDAAPVQLTLPPDQAAAKLDAIALASPGTTKLAGEGLFTTYITRSKLWGFPDFTSVKLTPTATGSELTLFARARFGYSDMGVNQARVENWLAQLQP
ncbi:DUF1499 domain-containing protein [Rhodobacter ferrooxidans]|nr:DUF1499 domain-containing protein [Rhodobacter sp. SW2]